MWSELLECLVSYPASFGKNSPACRGNSPQEWIGDSRSPNSVSFSSARAMNRFPLLRTASAIPIVRPLESIAQITPRPSSSTEIVRDYFRLPHAMDCDSFLDRPGNGLGAVRTRPAQHYRAWASAPA